MDDAYLAAIPGWIRIDDGLALAGQPSEEQLRALARQEFAAVVNLAPSAAAEGTLPDEAGLLRSLGIRYFHLPVTWTAPNLEDYSRFTAVMDSLRGMRTLVHCARNLRVTVFYALYAEDRHRWDRAHGEALIDLLWKGRPEISPGGTWREYVEAVRAARTAIGSRDSD